MLLYKDPGRAIVKDYGKDMVDIYFDDCHEAPDGLSLKDCSKSTVEVLQTKLGRYRKNKDIF